VNNVRLTAKSKLPQLCGMMLGLVLLIGASGANAAAITWTLNNVTTVGTGLFAGVPGTLTGSFDYDATTNTYSNILIRHTPNSVEPTPLTFSTFSSGTSLTLTALNGPPDPDGSVGRHSVAMVFASALTNAGGSVPISSGHVSLFTGARGEDITGGTVSADAATATVPATWGALKGLYR